MQEQRGALAEPLDEREQAAADEADLATLRRMFGDEWQITYNADDWTETRWDARPWKNVGNEREKITAAGPGALADKLAGLRERGTRA